MKTRLAIALCFALMVSGCQMVQEFVVTGSDENTRVITVTAVDGEVEITGRVIKGKHRLSVNVEPATPEPDTAPRRTRIKFKLERGYQFTSDGIQLCPPSPASKACSSAPVNPRCETDGGARRVIICRYDTPPDDTVYWYTINVIHVDSGTRVTLDPSIWN